MSSFAMPEMPHNARIDAIVAAFAELLYAPALAVVCRWRPTGDVIAVNAYRDPLPAMLAVWANDDSDTAAEAHPTCPLTEAEEDGP